jgi:hypothetical protein
MGSTFIAGQAETYRAKCPVSHCIVMFSVLLYIFTKFKAYVFVVVDLLSSHDTSW